MPGQVRRDDFETRLQRAYQWQKVLELGTKWLHQHDRRPGAGTHVSEIVVTKTQRLLSHRMSSLHVLIPPTATKRAYTLPNEHRESCFVPGSPLSGVNEHTLTSARGRFGPLGPAVSSTGRARCHLSCRSADRLSLSFAKM